MEDNYVIVKNGDEVIVNTQNSKITVEDINASTSFVVHYNGQEYSYSSKVDKNGGLINLGSGNNLSRADTISLVGGQKNYNTLLASQGISLPSVMKSLDETTVTAGGIEVKPYFAVYDNGDIYINGSNVQITEAQMKEFWPNTYKKILGDDEKKDKKPTTTPTAGGTSTGANNTTSSQTTGGTQAQGGGSSQKQVGKDGSTGNEKTNNQAIENITQSNPESQKDTTTQSTGSTDTIITFDYNALHEQNATLKANLNNINEQIEIYKNALAEMSGSSSWEGADKDLLLSKAAGEYLAYLEGISANIKSLNEQIDACIAAFEDAESRILALTI